MKLVYTFDMRGEHHGGQGNIEARWNPDSCSSQRAGIVPGSSWGKGRISFSYIGQIERGEKNVSLLNLYKIAESLEVNLIQLFAYLDEEFMVTSAESDIQDIVELLRDTNDEKIRMAKNVLREILRGNASS